MKNDENNQLIKNNFVKLVLFYIPLLINYSYTNYK